MFLIGKHWQDYLYQRGAKRAFVGVHLTYQAILSDVLNLFAV